MVIPRAVSETQHRSSVALRSSPRILALSKRNIKRLIVYRNGNFDAEAKNVIIPQNCDWDKLLDECTKVLCLTSRAKKIWTYDGVPVGSVHDIGDQTRIFVGLSTESFKRPNQSPIDVARATSIKTLSSDSSSNRSELISSVDGVSIHAFDEMEESMFSTSSNYAANNAETSDLTFRLNLPVVGTPSRVGTPPRSPPEGAQSTPHRSPCFRSIELCISPLSPMRTNIDDTASVVNGKHSSPEEVGCKDCTKRLFTGNPAPLPHDGSQLISSRINSAGKFEDVFDIPSRASTQIPRPAPNDKDDKENNPSIHVKKLQSSSRIPAPKVRAKVAADVAQVGLAKSSTVADAVSKKNLILVNETASTDTNSSQEQIKEDVALKSLNEFPTTVDPFPEAAPSAEQLSSPDSLDPLVQNFLEADDVVMEEDSLPTPKIVRRISGSRIQWIAPAKEFVVLPGEPPRQCQEIQKNPIHPASNKHGPRKQITQCARMMLRLILRGLLIFAVVMIVYLVGNVETEVPC